VTPVKRKKAKGVRGGAREGAGRPRTADADRAILSACLDRLETVGYGPLTIDDVAAAAGVAKATVYRRWPSKVALVQAAAAPFYQQSLEMPNTGSLRSDLLIMLETTRTLFTGRSGRILKILIQVSAEHPELSEMLQSDIYRRRKLYHQVLSRSIARNETRPDIDHELVTELLIGPFWSRTLVAPSPIPAELVVQIVDAVLGGVSARRHR
jgi:AcrR family transcriptional regulator